MSLLGAPGFTQFVLDSCAQPSLKQPEAAPAVLGYFLQVPEEPQPVEVEVRSRPPHPWAGSFLVVGLLAQKAVFL